MLNQDASAKDYQKHLEDNILRLNFRSFTQVVILGSSSFVPFMRLQPRWRRMVVEEILDIEIFTRMNILLREKNKAKDEEIRSADFSVNLFEEKIQIKINIYKTYSIKINSQQKVSSQQYRKKRQVKNNTKKISKNQKERYHN